MKRSYLYIFSILAILFSTVVIPSGNTKAWTGNLPTCGEKVDKLNLKQFMDNVWQQPGSAFNDDSRIIVYSTSTDFTNIFVRWFPATPNGNPNFQVNSGVRALHYSAAASPASQTAILNGATWPDKLWYTGTINIGSTTGTNTANITCISFANNIPYSTQWTEQGIAKFPVYDFTPAPPDPEIVYRDVLVERVSSMSAGDKIGVFLGFLFGFFIIYFGYKAYHKRGRR